MKDVLSISCTGCGTKAEVEICSSINVSDSPEMKSKVLDGSVFIWECPECKRKNLLKYKTLYHDPEARLMIWLTGGDSALETAVMDNYSRIEEMKAYIARFVDDAGSLIEKVKIFDFGLDDIVVEMCKYVTNMETGKDIPLKFLKLDGPDNDIILTYPSNGRMEMLNLGFNVYEDCRGIVQRNPSISQAAEGFAKVDSSWIAGFFR